ncbi:MAG: DUF3352 domain-containing protein [Chloroflexota bacterium]
MRRLVVASTALLVMLGVAVVFGYLLLFSAVADRAARAVPADTALYVKVYLQPSTGQQMNLLRLLGRVPGLRDPAALEGKIHEVTQRLLAEAGLDYGADLRPWLGSEIALALARADKAGGAPQVLLLAIVRDPVAARVEVPRLMARDGATYTAGTYRGRRTMIGKGASYALLDDLLLVANTPDRLRAAIDAEANAAASLADSAAFGTAMRTIAADHLASLYLDLRSTTASQAGGYSTAALALTAAPDGLHLDGAAPFARVAAGEPARAAFLLGSKPASLAAWMPRTTRVEMAAFGPKQSLAALEGQMAADPSFADARDALNQLRAIAALGLGINVDRDLLSLFDGEAALALRGIDLAKPGGLLLLRPSDPASAADALRRMADGLLARGSTASSIAAAGATVTSLTIPQVGRVAYALVDGVALLALDPADVSAALEAHAGGDTLASDGRYTRPFVLAGAHKGNEIWADIPGLADAAAGIFDPGSELRDILHQIGELAMTASADDDRLQIHAVLTVK